MRRLVSAETYEEYPPMGDIIGQTNILELIAEILEYEVSSEEQYFMRCEAIWILTNLATVEEDDELQMILSNQITYG